MWPPYSSASHCICERTVSNFLCGSSCCWTQAAFSEPLCSSFSLLLFLLSFFPPFVSPKAKAPLTLCLPPAYLLCRPLQTSSTLNQALSPSPEASTCPHLPNLLISPQEKAAVSNTCNAQLSAGAGRLPAPNNEEGWGWGVVSIYMCLWQQLAARALKCGIVEKPTRAFPHRSSTHVWAWTLADFRTKEPASKGRVPRVAALYLHGWNNPLQNYRVWKGQASSSPARGSCILRFYTPVIWKFCPGGRAE